MLKQLKKTVVAPLESALNNVPGLLYMHSNSSSSGSLSLHMTFAVGSDMNIITNEVLNRINSVNAILPDIIKKTGLDVRRVSADMLLSLVFYNDGGNLSNNYLSSYIKRVVISDFNLVPGVGEILFHGQEYSIRVWLDPHKMFVNNVVANDVVNAIQEQNKNKLVGTVDLDNHKIHLTVVGGKSLVTTQEFNNIVILNRFHKRVLLKDVARVELGSNYYNVKTMISYLEHKQLKSRYVAFLQVNITPGANQLLVKKLLMQRIQQDSHTFPHGIKYKVIFDATHFIYASIINVLWTLLISFVLVAMVILLFLQDIKASLITLITVPVSLLGGIIMLYILGYSINTFSLFAMVLSIGIVVDDAIVIIENIQRVSLENPNFSLKEAILLAVNQVFKAVIAISLVLSVVFLPVMALPGIAGALYRQFAIVIACNVLVSALLSLTLVPSISYLLLDKKAYNTKIKLKFSYYFNKVIDFIVLVVTQIMKLGKLNILLFILSIVLLVFIFRSVPLGFMPNEDQGFIMSSVVMSASSSLQNTEKTVKNISFDILHATNGVHIITSLSGVDFFGDGINNNVATIIVLLKDWHNRNLKKDSVNNIVNTINSLNKKYPNASIHAFAQPPLRGVSKTNGVEFFLEGRTVDNINQLLQQAKKVEKSLMKSSEVKNAYHTISSNSNQVLLDVDPYKAAYYHIDIADVYTTLNYIYGTAKINYTDILDNVVWVNLKGDYPYRKDLNTLSKLYVRSTTGALIPLTSVVSIKNYNSPIKSSRFNGYDAISIIVVPTHSFGKVMSLIPKVMQHYKHFNFDWTGISYLLSNIKSTAMIALSFSILLIYLLLCALYELWLLPLIVLMAIPFSFIGVGLILLITGRAIDLYCQVSLIALLGLSTKNIILLIEFGLQEIHNGQNAKNAIISALRVRFRPIIMTSITFICGAIPLVLATGAGAQAQHSVATGIIGGMLGSLIFGILIIPSYFVLFSRVKK